MRTRNHIRTLLFLFLGLGLVSLTVTATAQDKSGNHSKQNTITIHVIKEVDGKTIVIDTTVVNNENFDADAFLQEKGVTDNLSEDFPQIKKRIIIPDRENEDELEGETADTMNMEGGKTIIIKKGHRFNMPDMAQMPHPESFDLDFEIPEGPAGADEDHFNEMIEGLANVFGPDGAMPCGEMKQIVVTKKHHGKKVVITFKDNDNASCSNHHGKHKHSENVMMYNYSYPDSAHGKKDRIVISGRPKIKIISSYDDDKNTPVHKKKKVIVIKDKEE